MEKEFKDFKEKLRYYAELAKQEKMFFVSAMPLKTQENAKKVKGDLLIKGNTYIKAKEEK